MDIFKETMEHFEPKEDRFAGFKSYNLGGQQVIDLTSVDVDWRAYETKNNAFDIERQQIYGNEASNPNRM